MAVETPKHNGWIPCEDMMPKEDCQIGDAQGSECVLVKFCNHEDGNNTFVDMAYTLDGEWMMYRQNDDGSVKVPMWYEAIEWMPLPKLRRAKK